MDHFEIDIGDFAAFLEGRADFDFPRWSSCDCPLAQYLKSQGISASVGGKTAWIEGVEHHLDPWCHRFVNLVDGPAANSPIPISGRRALLLLNVATNRTDL